MTGQPVMRDAGAQAERTLLSWTRTSIALVAVGALLLRLSVAEAPGVLVAMPLLLLTAASLHLAARRRYRSVSSGSDQPAGRLLAGLTVVAVTVSALCAVSVLA